MGMGSSWIPATIRNHHRTIGDIVAFLGDVVRARAGESTLRLFNGGTGGQIDLIDDRSLILVRQETTGEPKEDYRHSDDDQRVDRH